MAESGCATEGFSSWLRNQGFSQKIIEVFEENEVGKEEFLLLTDDDITEMIQPIGARRKLISMRKAGLDEEALASSQQDPKLVNQVDSDNDQWYDFEESAFKVISSEDDEPGSPKYYSDEEAELQESDFSLESSQCQPSSSALQTKANDVTSSLLHKNKIKKEPAFTHLKIVKRAGQPEKALPIPFELPYNYPKDVTEDLKQNRLSSRSRAKFIASICSAIFSHKVFPTTHEYNHVGEQIVNQYPFLKSKSGSGYGYLVEAMRDKMKNIRNTKPRAKRPATKDNPSNTVPNKKQKMAFLPKYPVPPKISLSEDDASYGRHVKRLQLEAQKPSPDKQTVRTLMNVTYPFRRNEILEKGMEISEVLKMYPPLKKIDQIYCEFNRIFEKEMIAIIKDIWEETRPKIYEVAKTEHGSAIKALYDESASSDSEESKALYAVMMLVHLLPDTRTAANTNRIVTFINEYSDPSLEAKELDQPQPLILVRGTVKKPKEAYLVSEQVVMSKVKMEEIPVNLFATYYVFNMEYCPGARNFFGFLETIFLNIPVQKKTKINHLLNMLDNITD